LSPLRRFAALGLLLLAAGGALRAAPADADIVPNPDPGLIDVWQPCEPGIGVTVIVDRYGRLGDGKIDVRCAPGAQPNGVAALQNAGFQVAGTSQYGLGFICRIDNQPEPSEQTCEQTPGGKEFWGYFVGRPGGRWGASGVGALNPLSAAPIDSVQGWGFGGGPRIEPMNGAGPSAFTLPPAQESSTIPAARARKWLLGAMKKTIELEGQPGSGVNVSSGQMLEAGLALARAGVGAPALAPLLRSFDRREQSGAYDYSTLQAWANSVGTAAGLDPEDPSFPLWGNLSRYALALEAIGAMGGDVSDFAGTDLRGEVLAMINEANGKVLKRALGGGTTESAGAVELAAAVKALAATGTLPDKALKSLDLLLGQQDPLTGAFADGSAQPLAIEALAAARRSGVAGLDEPIEKAGEDLETVEEGIAQPTFPVAARAAVGLGLAGRGAAAERAAKLVSRYQVTAEYAGAPDLLTGEPAPAEPLVGAFLGEETALKAALAYGLSSPYEAAQLPTAEALEALGAAGPYGPLDAEFDEPALFFEGQIVATESGADAVTLSNFDPRPLIVESIEVEGGGGDFRLDASACEGRALATGASCELAARFTPTATGLREELVTVALDGGQRLRLSLSGTGLLGGDPGPGPEPEPKGGGGDSSGPVAGSESGRAESAAPAPGIVAIRARSGVHRSTKGGVAEIATLSCPAGSPCRLGSPARVRLAIAGKRYWATVLAPRSLAGGASAKLRVRLPRAARAALARHSATVVVPVTLTGATGPRVVRVKAKLGAAGAPGRGGS